MNTLIAIEPGLQFDARTCVVFVASVVLGNTVVHMHALLVKQYLAGHVQREGCLHQVDYHYEQYPVSTILLSWQC